MQKKTAENLLKIAISNSGANGNMERLSETFEKISAIEYPNNVNTSGLSFNNEMRLVVCKSIVTKLGGHIAADSKDGKTMLTLSLPPMNISEEKTIEKYSSYEELQEGARIENAEMYKEQLMNKLKSLQDYYKSSVSAYQFTYGRILHREDKEFIDKMMKIISENISDTNVTTAFIAEKLGVSVRTLYNKLEGLISTTPNNIIKEFRLSYAEQLLSTTKLTIDEIIFKSGFANRGTFFKNFSAKYGCTPKSYRAKLNNRLKDER